MRIAYVCRWDAFSTGGVSQKISSQVEVWRAHGHHVQVFCLSPAPERARPRVLDATLFPYSGWRERLRATLAMRRAVSGFAPDVVYVRYSLFLPPLGGVLRRHVSVAEINTDSAQELKPRARLAHMYEMFHRRSMLGSVSGVVCLTHELAAGIPRDKPCVVIANGVRLDGVSSRDPGRDGPPVLVFLAGSPDPWQGLDKFAALAGLLPEWRFVVVGEVPAGVRAGLPSQMVVTGALDRAGYGPILAGADVGVGTLALHRKGMSEACPLKVREYLAHGLPVIVGYEDTEFMGCDPWFVLRLANRESNVRDGVGAVRDFVARVGGRRVERERVAPLIAAEVKEAERLSFLTRLHQRAAAGPGASPTMVTVP